MRGERRHRPRSKADSAGIKSGEPERGLVSTKPQVLSPSEKLPELVAPVALQVLYSVDAMQPERNPALCYLAELRESGRATQKCALEEAARVLSVGTLTLATFPWHALQREHVVWLKTQLQDRGAAPATVNKKLAALRRVALIAFEDHRTMSAECYLRISKVAAAKGKRGLSGRALTSDEIAKLFASCAESGAQATGARDAVILALLFGGALRRHESAILTIGDYDPESRKIRFIGKGNKEGSVKLAESVAMAIDDWLELRRAFGVELDRTDPLICKVSRDGRRPLEGLVMSYRAIWKACAARAERAGVAKFTPHDLRRSMSTALIDAGADLLAVRERLRHSQLSTTQRYDLRAERAADDLAELVPVPYTSPKKPPGKGIL